MSSLPRHAENRPENRDAQAPKAPRGPFFRRLRAMRDMAFVLGAWMGSWAVVILVVKGLTGLF